MATAKTPSRMSDDQLHKAWGQILAHIVVASDFIEEKIKDRALFHLRRAEELCDRAAGELEARRSGGG